MATVAQRLDSWVELACDLVTHPRGSFPRHLLLVELAATFDTHAAWHWNDARGAFGFEMDEPIDGWPTAGQLADWAPRMTSHPLPRWYEVTHDPCPMTIGRVPRHIAPREGFDAVRESLEPVGLEQQMSIPLRLRPSGSHTFVIAQAGRDFHAEDLELARRLQPLLALVDSRYALLQSLSVAHPNPSGLTGRELAVLALLNDGCTARAIARRLRISPRTVHAHLGHIYRKLGVRDRLQAVLLARDLGLLQPTCTGAVDLSGDRPRTPVAYVPVPSADGWEVTAAGSGN
jgi:DNA-binding CsgD family transcriptional regulator